MILRIVFGRFPSDIDANALVELRGRLARAARDVPGLDSLIVGARRIAGGDPDVPVEAAIVTIWRDVALMARATDVDEQDRFLGLRLRLPLEVVEAVHYEIVGRTFAALPPETAAYLRLITVRARPNEEARLIETLRDQQPKLVELGLVASHLGRRVVGRECEAVTVGVWPDRATIRRATGGRPERPLFAQDLADWADRLNVETYDGIEIAPRLPAASGPPIYVIDEDLRIVDITAAAAAAIGWPAEDLVGKSVLDISLADPESRAEPWERLLHEGRVSGEGPWHVPDAGAVFIRYIAERDVPIVGRHTVLVHRWHEPVPTAEDLDAALAEAFPSRTRHVTAAAETSRPPASPREASMRD
jgi:PAS domain-containing protein